MRLLDLLYATPNIDSLILKDSHLKELHQILLIECLYRIQHLQCNVFGTGRIQTSSNPFTIFFRDLSKNLRNWTSYKLTNGIYTETIVQMIAQDIRTNVSSRLTNLQLGTNSKKKMGRRRTELETITKDLKQIENSFLCTLNLEGTWP